MNLLSRKVLKAAEDQKLPANGGGRSMADGWQGRGGGRNVLKAAEDQKLPANGKIPEQLIVDISN